MQRADRPRDGAPTWGVCPFWVRRHHYRAKGTFVPTLAVPPLNRWAIPVKC
jgi:hypothetical protein